MIECQYLDLRHQGVQQLARADHLADQVEDHDDQRAERRHHAHRLALQAIGGDVGEGVFAEVAQPLRDQEQHDRPADQPADRVVEAIEAVEIDECRDAKEGGGRHVVAGDGKAVLEGRDAASGSVEVGGAFGALGRPVGDAESERDEHQEHHDGVPVDRRPIGRVGGEGGGRQQRERRGRDAGEPGRRAHHLDPSRSLRVRSSKVVLAFHT